MHDNIISASILSADMTCLGKEANAVLNAGADWLHIDVMDHHYVPNLTFGPLICQALRRHLPKIFLDVHLMVKPIDALIDAFAEAGADQISFHPDASENITKNLQQIRQWGCKAGLAINPEISLDCLNSLWEQFDLLLIMSVHPGFAGQVFIPKVLDKIAKAQQLIQQYNPSIRIGIDGGVKQSNIAEIANKGANTFILGSAIFTSLDYSKTITEIRAILSNKGK